MRVGRMAAALAGMAGSLPRHRPTTAAAIAAGDLTRDVSPRSEHDVLGRAFRSR